MKIKTKMGMDNTLLITLYLLSIFDTLRLISFENFSLFFLAVIFIYYLARNGFRMKRKAIPIFAFVLTIILSSILNVLGSEIAAGSLSRPIRIGFALVVGYIYAQLTGEKERWKLYKLIFSITVIGIIWGVIQYITGNAYESNFLRVRISSFFGNPIIYGSILVGTAWLINYLNNDYYKRWIYSVAFAIAIYSTGSRSSWIAIIIIFLVFILIRLFSKQHAHINHKALTAFVLGATVIVFFIRSSYFDIAINYISSRFSGSFAMLMQTRGARHRIAMSLYLIKTFFQSSLVAILFGHGPTSANIAGRNSGDIVIAGFSSADNGIVTYLYEYGLICFVLLVLLIVSLIKHFKDDNSEIQMLSYSIAAIIITGFFYELLSWKSICVLLMIYIGIFLNLTLPKETRKT